MRPVPKFPVGLCREAGHMAVAVLCDLGKTLWACCLCWAARPCSPPVLLLPVEGAEQEALTAWVRAWSCTCCLTMVT